MPKPKRFWDDSQQRFQTTEQDFANVLVADQAIKGVADKALKVITGGSSFPVMFPISVSGKGVFLSARNMGTNPLTGVNVTMYRVTEKPWTQRDISVGTVAGGATIFSSIQITPNPGKDGVDTYLMFISAQNGVYQEKLLLKESETKGVWAHRYRVWRMVLTPTANDDSSIKAVPIMIRDKWADDTQIPVQP